MPACASLPPGPSPQRLPAWRRVAPLPVLALTAQALLTSPPAHAQAQPAERPPGLVVLVEKTSTQGPYTLGVFHPRPDPEVPNLWLAQIWQEISDRVTVSSERLNCDPRTPMRILRSGSSLELRHLNPGGAITLANRLDHQLWWAVCHPSLAGRDPSGLAEEARRRGFSGQLVERIELVPAAP